MKIGPINSIKIGLSLGVEDGGCPTKPEMFHV